MSDNEHPNLKLTIDGHDFTQFIVSVQTTQRENNVTDLTFKTATEELTALPAEINSKVQLYLNDVLVFSGDIETINRDASTEGFFTTYTAVDSVCAVLKRMVVNCDFGTQSRIGQANPTVDQKLSNAVLQVLHDYVARVSGNPRNQESINPFSRLKTEYWINDGWIYQEPNSVKFPYINLKYCDALTALGNLIRLHSALSYKRSIDNNGTIPFQAVHFITDVENRLLLAPVGNHDVESTAGNQIAGLWHTYANNGEILTVGEDQVVNYSFTEEAPYANIVYVAGKYKWPPNDELTENSAKYWGNTWGVGGSIYTLGYQFPANKVSDSTIAISKGKKSLKLEADVDFPNTTSVWNTLKPQNAWESLTELTTTDGDPSFFYTEINAEFLKLVSPESPAYINFTCYTDPNITRSSVLLLNDLGTAQQEANCFSTNLNLTSDKVDKVSVDVTYDDIHNGPTTKWKAHGTNPDWANIKYLGFAFRKDLLMTLYPRSLYIDDLSFSGDLIRAVTDNAMWSTVPSGVPPVFQRNPNYKYPTKMFTYRDSLSFSDNLLVTPQSTDSLYLNAVHHLMMYGSKLIRGTVMLPLDTNYTAGQFVKVCNNKDVSFYKDQGQDYKTFRITEVTHNFSTNGALTTLSLCNDLVNSTPRQYNEYTEAVRALSPKHQDSTFSSLYTENAFDVDSYILASRVALPKVDY